MPENVCYFCQDPDKIELLRFGEEFWICDDCLGEMDLAYGNSTGY